MSTTAPNLPALGDTAHFELPISCVLATVDRLPFVPMLVYNIDHVAIAVHDLDASLMDYDRKYNVAPISVETVEDQGVREAMLAIGGSHIQLLEPLTQESPVGKFLARNGEGLHHIAFAVVDIDDALRHLTAEGARLIDKSPRIGGGGHRIAFVHPTDLGGTLIELVEVSDG